MGELQKGEVNLYFSDEKSKKYFDQWMKNWGIIGSGMDFIDNNYPSNQQVTVLPVNRDIVIPNNHLDFTHQGQGEGKVIKVLVNPPLEQLALHPRLLVESVCEDGSTLFSFISSEWTEVQSFILQEESMGPDDNTATPETVNILHSYTFYCRHVYSSDRPDLHVPTAFPSGFEVSYTESITDMDGGEYMSPEDTLQQAYARGAAIISAVRGIL